MSIFIKPSLSLEGLMMAHFMYLAPFFEFSFARMA